MIITKTPLRIPFFSGGSDIPAFFQHDEGAALSVTIDQYVYVVVHPTNDELRFCYDETETLSDIATMRHDITRETLRYFGVTKGLTIHSICDVNHKGTGLGSSSAYCVGLINALSEAPSKILAEAACRIEIERCKYPIGMQDQYAAAFGGFNLFTFRTDLVECRTSYDLYSHQIRDLNDSLVLINTGVTRHSGKILKPVEPSPNQLDAIRASRDMAYRAMECLRNNQLDGIGDLFNESWESKKKANPNTTNPQINSLYNDCMKAGAIGGKVLGAGGGGFLLLYVPFANRREFDRKLGYSKSLPFKFTQTGSSVIYRD